MLVTYKNRKNNTYTLYRIKTKTGKSRYCFAKKCAKGKPCETVPHGYEISESPNGVVSLVKSRPKLIRKSEVAIVQKLIDKNPSSSKYRIFVRHNRIDIYEYLGPSADEMIDLFREGGAAIRLTIRSFEKRIIHVASLRPPCGSFFTIRKCGRIERSACVTLGALMTGSTSARPTGLKYWQET